MLAILRVGMLFGKRSQQQFLKKFRNDPRFYCHRTIIDYFPPSRHFIDRRETSQDGVVTEPIVLLSIVLPFATELFRWQRPGVVEMIQQATLGQSLEPVFMQLEKDIRREVERSLWNWRI
jgi:hypothetical protein